MQVSPASEGGAVPQTQPAEREVSPEDKKLAADWQKRIEAALKRVEKKFKKFEQGRRRLAALAKDGGESEEVTDRAPLHFANMAALLPQVYAKDPEFTAKPTRAVPAGRMEVAKRFAATGEFMLQKFVVKDAGLKKQAKKQIRSCYATSVGWIKASWQEKKATDPLILNRIKDTQDNIERVQYLLQQSNDPQACKDHELAMAQLKQALEGLQGQQEVKVARGVALDFVMSEDLLVIDPSILDLSDYTRSAALGHRVWMTAEQYERNFGYRPKKAKSYTQQASGKMSAAANTGKDQDSSLVCVWEVWSQDDNRVFYVCDGEEGFCKEPQSPEWTGKRWYPFFLVAFNEIDGSFYPLSDIELTDKLVKEYNESREDFVRDRKEALPIKVVRKGGSLTDSDVKNLSNASGGDTIIVEGVGNQPLTNDMWMGQLGKLDAAAYDTSAARYDMERILGGADANTGSITKAKTATEAEILSQGLRSRAGERQDVLEDMLNELGPYCLEMMLRKFSEAEVKKFAGEDAVWPQLDLEGIFNLVTVEVRGGSTGKPDRLQEQDRWTKLLPIINEAVQKIAELRTQGQEPLAQAVIELTRETLRRFDERLDIEQFLPKAPQGPDDPNVLKQQVVTLTGQLQDTQAKLKDAADKVEKGFISAAADIATSANPAAASLTFTHLIGMPMPDVSQIIASMDPAQMQPAAGQPPAPGQNPGMPQPAPQQPDPLSQPQAAQPPQNDAIPPQLQPPVSQP
jgi:hypothetical protein